MSNTTFVDARNMLVYPGRRLGSIAAELERSGFHLAYATVNHPFYGKSFCFTRSSAIAEVFESIHCLSADVAGAQTITVSVDLSPNSLGPFCSVDLERLGLNDVFDLRSRSGVLEFEDTLSTLGSEMPATDELALSLAGETESLRELASSALSQSVPDTMLSKPVEDLLPKPWNIPAESDADVQRCREAYFAAAYRVSACESSSRNSRSVCEGAVEVVAGKIFDPELYSMLSCRSN